MTQERWRLFVAGPLPAPAADALWMATERARADARRSGLPVRWVAASNLHITLHFLGATDPAAVAGVVDVLRAAAGRNRAVRLSVAEAGAFPDVRRPSVVWAGLRGDLDALTRMQSEISNGLAPLGFRPESRPFHPHITIGRAGRVATPAQRRRIGALLPLIDASAPVFTVDSIVLFRTVAQRGLTRYAAIASLPLRSDD